MKNILHYFVMGAAVLGMSAALASCQKESANDKTSTPETPAVRVIHVDLDANVAETKASYAEKVVTIQDYDQLYIALTGPGSAWTATGTLTFATDKFSGDITITGPYAGSDPITAAKDLTATFLPNGYDSVNYLSATGEATAANAFYAGTKDASVPQLVHLTATVSNQAGVAKTPLTLVPQNAVLCYSINANKLSAGAHTVSVSDGTTTISGSVTAVADAATTFAVAFPANATALTYTLSIAGYNDVAKSGKTLVAGKVVNIATDVEDATISGVFSVGPTTTVKFSKGNLQYNSNTQAWQFAEHQYTYVGNAAGNTSVTEDGIANNSGIVDLFGWVGASSNWTGLKQYGISSSTAIDDVNGYGNVDDESLKSDWGTLIGTGWRTLTGSVTGEWNYLFNTRTVNGGTGSGKSYTLGQSVEGKLGVVLYPDNYTGPVYSGRDWSTFEAAGCVFLPAAGHRIGTSVYSVGSYGLYWSSTPNSSNVNLACILYFSSGGVGPANYSNRSSGLSVRLVQIQN